ncbi:MAG: T9SS type A sorting domain-containing protein [Bacteroidales bacterium]
MQKYLLTLLWLLVYGHSFCTHMEVTGNVSGTWDVDTVMVMANLNIQSGEVLVINPDVLVLFQGHYLFRVEGQIIAMGEANQQIVFSVNDTTGFSGYLNSDGAWNGFWFDNLAPDNDSSLFQHCRFEYGKALGSDSIYWYGGAVCIRDYHKIRFSNCNFNHNRAFKNGGAIYSKKGDIKIENCVFENNDCGQDSLYGYGGGICLEYANAIVCNNEFTNNSSTGVGGGLSFEHSDPKIVGNYFYYNYSAIGGGFVSLRSNGSNPVVNNLVVGNSSLFFGGGIAIIEASIPFTNNTLVENYSVYGGGLYLNFNSFPVFKNCIVWNNSALSGEGPQVYVWDTYSAPEFYYCDLEGGVTQIGGTGGGVGFIGVYNECIENDPVFSGGNVHPYSITDNSPCINKGTIDTTGMLLPENDFAGDTRIRNGRVDIGAYEAQIETGTENFTMENPGISLYPNPACEEVTLEITLGHNDRLSISLFDERGIKTLSLADNEFQKGEHKFTFDLSCINPGIYFIKIESATNHSARKLVIKR